ncbi:MAG: gamma-glutamyl-gamma-aminobutyrate hydrolase family protein [Synergistaceae bacterium]|nr:gamma-glutamyl-gamma-aminobutyrate hydrolase family protein [Synergistaceae bacterium]
MEEALDYPVVGIGANVDDDSPGVQNIYSSYVEAVYNAGCVPMIIPLPDINLKHLYGPLAARALHNADGLLLSGGNDVDAAIYGEDNMPYNGSFSEERDRFELALAKCAARMKKPILGICRGVQLLNVAMGGTLFQDIGKQHRDGSVLMHSQKAASYSTVHKITFSRDSKIACILLAPEELDENADEGGFVSIGVNSFHHQAVKGVAPGFKASAHSSDGIIEAIEPDGTSIEMHPFTIGVQWHPERLWRHHAHAERLFRQYADACRAQASLMGVSRG